MGDDLILHASYLVIAPAWLALLVAPDWRPTRLLIRSAVISLVLAGLYLALVLFRGGEDPDAGVWTMDELTALFSDRRVVLIGWVHYLAFDLFVGSWVAASAARDGIARLLVAPCLVFVCLLYTSDAADE